MRKPVFGVSDKVLDINQHVQPQKKVRDQRFWIHKVEELYHPCSEKKALISFAVTAKLICAFAFAYANNWGSHAMAHIKANNQIPEFLDIQIYCLYTT